MQITHHHSGGAQNSRSLRLYLLGLASGAVLQYWIAATLDLGSFLQSAPVSSSPYNHRLAAVASGERSRSLELIPAPPSALAEQGEKHEKEQAPATVKEQRLPPPLPPLSEAGEKGSQAGAALPPNQLRKQPEPAAVGVDGPKRSFKDYLVASGSDKYPRHHYERYYESWLRPYRSRPGLKFLEIGARHGHSLQLWEDYFDNPELIVGLAYAVKNATHLEEKLPGLPHVRVHWGDQSDSGTMERLRDAGPWDVVVDDGSHVPQHMVYSLYSLWPSVKPGGLYVIEDLETNYWPDGMECQGYPLNGTGIGAGPEYSAVSKLEQIQQVLVRHQIGATALSVMPGDHDLCSIEWGMNLVALRKCESPLAFAKPRYFNPRFDAQRMEDWIREARRTNPPPFDQDMDAATAQATAR